MLDRAERRRAGAAVVACDVNYICESFRHARRHCADAGFADELHGNASARIDLLQIEDQLREVFDGIDVVMRRRRNQGHAFDRMT